MRLKEAAPGSSQGSRKARQGPAPVHKIGAERIVAHLTLHTFVRHLRSHRASRPREPSAYLFRRSEISLTTGRESARAHPRKNNSMENTEISWTDHTFNPWAGCTRVSPACENCYAENQTKRYGFVGWGPKAERRITGEATWRNPLTWNRRAARENTRFKVFCASWADVFEGRAELDEPRSRLWDLIEETPNLDWLLLTKRPENIMGMAPDHWQGAFPEHVWVGTTVESPDYYERIDHLRNVPASIRFLSMEPLLADCSDVPLDAVQWVIVGGESGPGHRPMQMEWLEGIAKQCDAQGAPLWVKQWFGARSGQRGPIPDELWRQQHPK